MKHISFSIIIPTYNEELEIRETLNALRNLVWAKTEIIVVDDSTDSTPEIVKEFTGHGVKLVRPELRKGRCEARNIGIRAASGDVVVILNADVRLPPTFLESIAPLYEQGYECVSVMNEIGNQQRVYARYLQARRNWRIANGVYKRWALELGGVFWTEAFSVRRELALRAGLFPSGYPIPIEAGEDARFAEGLRRAKCRGVFAEDIVVPHIAPETLREFWRVRKGRGAGTPQIRYFLDKWPSWKISAWRHAKILQRLVRILTVAPLLHEAYGLARHMPGSRVLETLRYTWVIAVQEAASTVGEYQSHRRVRRAAARLEQGWSAA